MFKLVLEKATRDEIASIRWIIRKTRAFQRDIYFCFIDYTKPLTVWITTNCGNFFRDGNTRPLDLPLENCRSRNNS